MPDLIVVVHPLKILRFVVLFFVVQVDNKVVAATSLLAEVLGNQPVDIVVLPGFFTSDGNAGIPLGESWLQDISFIQFVFETYNTAFV